MWDYMYSCENFMNFHDFHENFMNFSSCFSEGDSHVLIKVPICNEISPQFFMIAFERTFKMTK